MELNFAALRARYRDRPENVFEVFDRIRTTMESDRTQSVWIHRADRAAIRATLERLLTLRSAGEPLPLFGLPFACKDNIDVHGMPTTAACAEFSYEPDRSATIVERLQRKGAVCLGKTNMDQFATGLTGTRSPYGICPSARNPAYIGGGSSSGSAVAVAKALASFSLGTDSGGSGRIPAGFNGIVGLKPTIGRVSLNGIVPNSRCFDCPSIFAANVDDAIEIFEAVEGFDESDPFSRCEPSPLFGPVGNDPVRFAVPKVADREWFGGTSSAQAFADALERLAGLGAEMREIDFSLFREAGAMMLSGPWVAERKAGIRIFFEQNPGAFLDIVRAVFERADRWSAVDVFEFTYRLMALRREALILLKDVDFLLVPTAPRPFTVAEVLAEPYERNVEVGHYSYFVNLLDLCAISVPNGLLPNGVPTGLTLVAPAWHDRKLALLARQLFAANQSEADLTEASRRRTGAAGQNSASRPGLT
ncbi:MAG: allophanate hydrolase [Pseudorhodoplanes sp.]